VNKNLDKRTNLINNKTLIVTVDFGKVKNSGYCRCPDGSEVPSFEFFNTGKGFHKFWRRVVVTMQKKRLSEVVVGFESTGPYGEPLMQFLHKRRVRMVQVNPSHTKKVKEIYDNSPNKTDKKDPKVMADLLELGRFLSVVIPEGVAAHLRRLMHARERALLRRTTFYNQLHDLIFLIFPEFLQVMKNLQSKSAHFLLNHYPTPESISRLGLRKMTKCLKQVSRGSLREEKIKRLHDAAQDSIGICQALSSIVDEIKQLLTQITLCDKSIGEIEQKLPEYLQKIPYSRSMLSIKGVGVITVAGLIGEMADFRQFRTLAEVMKFSGLNLYEISSGKRKGQRRISKRGRPLIRKLLYFAALNLVRKDGLMHEQYQRYLKRGMPKLKALIAIARKLLALIFALVRDNSTYDANYSNLQLLKQAA
jgi:transposase